MIDPPEHGQIALPIDTHGKSDVPPPPSVEAQRRHLLALAEVKGLGEVTLKALLRAYPDLGVVHKAQPDELRGVLEQAGLRNTPTVIEQLTRQWDRLLAEADMRLERFTGEGIHLLVQGDAGYPSSLLDLGRDAPPWLFVQGDPSVLRSRTLVAVVGTRQPSREGVDLARALTRWLVERGAGIVSGLAEGIDAAAHQTALDIGARTIGVLGTGILQVFPSSTAPLRARMVAEGGAVVSEYLPHDSYSASRFVRRNRIIAALAFATVPVEAHVNSGTAHTYRFAKSLKRLIVGIKRSKAPMRHGLLDLFKADHVQVYDLDMPESMENLEKRLRPMLGKARGSQATTQPFAGMLREFERVVSDYPITLQDIDALKGELDRLWKQSKGGG